MCDDRGSGLIKHAQTVEILQPKVVQPGKKMNEEYLIGVSEQ